MSENRKEQIIAAALKRFAHFGYQKTSMNEIAEDLHITKANLYYYYGDKATLLKDCAKIVMQEMVMREQEIIDRYEGGLLEVIYAMYDLHSEYAREYYMLSLYDQIELIKDLGINCIAEEFENKNKANVCKLFQKAIDKGEIVLEDVENACCVFYEISKGISILHRINDFITGIPDTDKIQATVESQKRAARFILEGKLRKKTK